MKTFTFLFLVLILSCSMSLWTSCSDDNGKDDPVPPEQPTDSIVKDTTWLITKLNIGTDDNNGVLVVNLTLDKTTKKVTKITTDDEGSTDYTTTYTMTYTDGKVTVACAGDFTDLEQIVYTLNDKGFVSKVDGGEDGGVFTFSYDTQNQLTSINQDDEPFFTVLYDANKNWKGFTLGDDIEDAVASASSLKNTCYNMDMNMLLVCDQMSMEVLSVAAYLGLFPASPNVISGFNATAYGEDLSIKVHNEKNADGSIKSLVADTELEGTTVEFSVIKIFSSEKQIVDRKIE